MRRNVYRAAVFVAISSFAIAAWCGDAPKPAGDAAPKIAWQRNLIEGFAAARQQGLPLLLVLEIPDQPWSRQLFDTMEDKDVLPLVARYHPVRLNIQLETRLLDELVVRRVPDVRVFNTDGKQLAHAFGEMSAAELQKFLTDAAGATPDKGAPSLAALFPSTDLDGLLKLEQAGRIPEGAALSKLLQLASGRSGETRAEAQRLLRKWSAPLAPALVSQLAMTQLKLRLTVWEIFVELQAPLEKYDPFSGPANADLLQRLEAWARELAAKAPVAAQAGVFPLVPAFMRAQVDADLQSLLDGDAARVDGARQRLLNVGIALVPELRNRARELVVKQPEQALKYDRLRFRLLLTSDILRRVPNAADQLADGIPGFRAAALGKILSSGGSGLDGLVREAACDRDALFRETAIRNALRASPAPDALLREALNDGEANVRVAALTAMAKTGRKENLTTLSEYLGKERDEDMVCHVVAAIAAVKSAGSAKLMRDVLKDPRWRVRAAAVEALGKLEDKESASLIAPLMLGDDGFVAAKAIETLAEFGAEDMVPQLAQVAEKHPGTITVILKALRKSSLGKSPATDVLLRKFTKNGSPEIRAQAILALARDPKRPAYDDVSAALKDTDRTVRAAAVEAMRSLIEEKFLDRTKPPKGYLDLRETIAAQLADTDEILRMQAAMTLAYYGDWKMGWKELETFIVHPKEALRNSAYDVLPSLPADQLLQLVKRRVDKKDLPFTTDEIYEIAYPIRKAQRTRATEWGESEPAVEAMLLLLPHVTQENLSSWYRFFAELKDGDDSDREAKGVDKAFTKYLEKRMAALPAGLQQNAVRMQWMNGADLDEEKLKVLLEDPDRDIRYKAALLLMDRQAKGPEFLVKKLIADPDPILRQLGVTAAVPNGWRSSFADPSRYEYVAGQTVYRRGQPSFPHSTTKLPNVVQLPIETLEALLRDSDPGVRGITAFLMALEGGDQGIRELHQQWKSDPSNRYGGTTLTQAVARAWDDSMTPIVEDLYNAAAQNSERDWELRSLYSTIRDLDGPNIKKLRARIRANHPQAVQW